MEDVALVLKEKRITLGDILRPVDLATVAYLLLLAVLIILFHNNLPGWGWYVPAHIGAALLVVALAWAGEKRFSHPVTFLRHWYPPLLFIPLFSEMNHLVNIIFPFWANGWLIRMDQALFGVYPTVWFEKLASPLLTELMAVFYLVYFLLIPAAALPLYVGRRMRSFHRLMFNTALSYYISFIIFLFIPAESPRVTLAHLQGGPMQGGPLLGVLRWLQGFGGIHGGAFPSSHVAAACAVLISTYIYERRVFRILLPFVLGLAISTTYCRYHYAVDALAGFLVGAVGVAIGQRLYLRWEAWCVSAGRRAHYPETPAMSMEPCAQLVPVLEEQRREHVGRSGSQAAELQREIE
jgi:membrane-associated phospholipid phosphatase